jgi:tetratricopeptide (TPR) repeat protein
VNGAVLPESRDNQAFKAAKRSLLLRDSFTFAVLLAVSLVLFGVTYFLFRSFESHREDLGHRWAQRGEAALTAHHPDQAVVALRAALNYAPDEVSYQLLLAQALADSGHTEEAAAYYLNRWETTPGDGLVNLQLARLARQKNDSQEAVEYYRAAIFGDWGANGAEKRRQVRLELSDYLIQRRDLAGARVELLIGASNAPDGPDSDLLYADRLQAAGDLHDALKYYDKAIADSPHQSDALEKAGRIAYALGDYSKAHSLLERALKYITPLAKGEAKNAPETAAVEERERSIVALEQKADRMQDLDLSRELSAHDRSTHLAAAAAIAQRRLNVCVAQVQGPVNAQTASAPPPVANGQRPAQITPASASAPLLPALQALTTRWKSASMPANRRAVIGDATAQDNLMALIFDTEMISAATCGQPQGDDALLLHMASDPVLSGTAGAK